MKTNIKVGDFVYVSDRSFEDAGEDKLLRKVSNVHISGSNNIITDSYGIEWIYSIIPRDIKILPMNEYSELTNDISDLKPGQELNHHQVLNWILEYKSLNGLSYLSCSDDDLKECAGELLIVDTNLKYYKNTWVSGTTLIKAWNSGCSTATGIFDHFTTDGSKTEIYMTDGNVFSNARIANEEEIGIWDRSMSRIATI